MFVELAQAYFWNLPILHYENSYIQSKLILLCCSSSKNMFVVEYANFSIGQLQMESRKSVRDIR